MDEKLEYILKSFPNAKCELNYHNLFELLVAVSLSAQTTDKKVNDATKELFAKYKDPYSLSVAPLDDVKQIIKPIGMANQKAKNAIAQAKMIHEIYHDVIPQDYDKLIKIPGVGNKTINVILAEGFKIPAFPVDTHINRIAKRLYFASINDDVSDVERKLKKKIPEELWIQMHHSMIFFGRYKCKAILPDCANCALNGKCRKNYK